MSIHDIIDTSAFCACLINILDTSIDQMLQNYDNDLTKAALCKCNVLLEHFIINKNQLNLINIESARKLYFDDYKLMLKECLAAVELCTEPKRIIKRIRILIGVLKKIKNSLNDLEESNRKVFGNFTFGNVSSPATGLNLKIASNSFQMKNTQTCGESIDSAKMCFRSFGITPTKCSILYETRSHQRNNSKPIPAQTANLIASLKRTPKSNSHTIYNSLWLT